MDRKGPLKGPHRKPPKAGPYAGPIPCLRCDREFQSWDRRHNRLCPRCRETLEREPSEEPSHALPMPIRRSRTQEDG
jgi:predicted amidophosphoribosyltransferase